MIPDQGIPSSGCLTQPGGETVNCTGKNLVISNTNLGKITIKKSSSFDY